MVRNSAACRGGWPHLDCPHPASLGNGHFGKRFEPDVLAVGRHGVGFRLEHEIRRPILFGQFPAIVGGPLFGRRHVFGISERSARVHPANDRGNLRVAQRNVVLKLLNPDGFVEMPRRHIPGGDPLLDGLGPRTGLLISDE